jgi:iron(III) transport system permease protein
MTDVALPRSGAVVTPHTRGRPSLMTFVVWFLIALIAVLIFYPLLTALVRVAADLATGADRVQPTDLLANQSNVYTNTTILVLCSGALALVIGSLLAWINERTDASLASLGRILPLAPLLIHPLASASGWVVLLDPRVGLMNGWIRGFLGVFGIQVTTGPLNVYTFPALIAVSTLQLVPFGFLIVSGALSRLDPALEEASRISRAGPLRTLVRVTLPAIAPSLANAAVVTLILGLGLFTVPVIIGTGARIDVLSVHIYNLINAAFPPKTAQALAFALVLMVIVQALLAAQRATLRVGRFTGVGGRGFRAAPVELGPWRIVARTFAIAYLAAAAVLPLIGLLMVSVQRFWTPSFDLSQLTLANYQAVLIDNRDSSQALLRSLVLAAGGATLVMLASATLMLQLYRGGGRAKQLTDVLTAVPATIPATVLGVGLLIAFSRPPIKLYGSPLLMLVAYFIAGLPFAARTAEAAASQVGAELAEASRVFRASSARTLWQILLPLALPGLAAGWVMVFVLMVSETTMSALLSGTGNLVIGRVLLDLWSNGSFPQMTALALLISLVDALCVLAVLRLTRRNFELAVS